MIRLIACLYRHPELSAEEFADHWRNVHGPLIRNEPTLARHLVRYLQHQPLSSGALSGTALAKSPDVDGVTEQWFRTQEDFVAFVSEPAYRELVAPDEAKLLDQSRTQFMLTEVHVDVIEDAVGDGAVDDGIVPARTELDGAMVAGVRVDGVGAEAKAADFGNEPVVVITGGASGLGRDLVSHLIQHHDIDPRRVVILDRREAAVMQTASELGCEFRVVDIGETNTLGTVIDEVWDAVGPITHLVNNAGVGNLKPFDQYFDADLSLLWQVNVMGTYAAIRSIAPRMAPGGAILNISSVSGVRPTRGEAPYSAAKAAVISLTQAAALEFAPHVRVNCLSPGFIHTPLNDIIASNDELRRSVESGTPLGRLGQPSDVSTAAAFLLSDRAQYITGQNLVVDGGSLLNSRQMDDVLTGLLDR